MHAKLVERKSRGSETDAAVWNYYLHPAIERKVKDSEPATSDTF